MRIDLQEITLGLRRKSRWVQSPKDRKILSNAMQSVRRKKHQREWEI